MSDVPVTASHAAAGEPPRLPPTEQITLGGGCFWCTEAVFLEVNGVLAVQSGYCNGHTLQPTYEDICTGETGHAEVVQITFDPTRIALADLLRIFLATHDPTTLNRQGADAGTQYRSGIYWHHAGQAEVARQVLAEAAAAFAPRKVVTELVERQNHSPAEAYHQRYFELHPRQGYCAYVIAPKVAKFREAFAAHRRT